jgi:hypothetical protein
LPLIELLFDGRFNPAYSDRGIEPSNPTVITIEGLPNYGTQAGAIVGWSTRFWPATRFKIEAFDVYKGANRWVSVVDFSSVDYVGYSYAGWLPGGCYTKLRFTFYSSRAADAAGRFGISELFFLHPEATRPYEGLLNAIPNLYGVGGNVGIGTANPSHKLSVNGAMRAKEVIVDTTWSDYVFADGYRLPPLAEVEAYIKAENHLPGIPSAQEVADQGVSVGEMQAKLLAKVEELTLHLIAQQKQIKELQKLRAENQVLREQLGRPLTKQSTQ